ncbi:MAG: hypothetical protein AAF603_04810, partial [Pseudomonadota bacterium]
MAKGGYNIGGDEVKEESSWRYPLIIFFTTLFLCIVFLYHYVGPDVDEIQGNKPRPTINDELLALSVGDISFSIPANYTVFPRDRRAGERENVSLYASWPRMNGYVPARREDFVENKPDARRIDMLIFEKQNPFTEQDRLNILYTPHIIDELGSPFDYNLTLYEFRQGSDNASGYAEKMMFTGVANDGTMAVLFCYPETEDNIVPA